MCIKRNNKIDLPIGRIKIQYFSACAFKYIFYLEYAYPNSFNSDTLEFASAVVNGMLSIELYLKFIASYDIAILNNGKKTHTYKTHDIRFLYKQLSKERKMEIIKKIKNNGCEESELKKFNKKHSYDFIDYRYFTKPKEYNTDYSIMVKFIDALYEISNNIINEYKFESDKIEPSAEIDETSIKIAKQSLGSCNISINE